MQELESVRQAVMDVLREQYSTAVFDLWFRDLKLRSLDEGCAELESDSVFKKGILQNKYTGVLSDAFLHVLGFSVKVHITAVPKEGNAAEDADFTPLAAAVQQGRRGDDPPHAPADHGGVGTGTAPAGTGTASPPITDALHPEGEGEKVPNIGADFESKKIFSQYTFDNFIVGESNKFAHAACIAVARNPATAYNPLFIYGQSGLGKTHLLYAITNEIKRTMPNVKIVYKKGDEFTNELIRSIQSGSMQYFRDKYRGADVLLIDDIQFIAGRESTQEEFFHTFNALHDADKQIILTSDRPPRDIKTLEDRLRTRFEWGLIADIQPPSLELRTAIILKKAEQLGITIPDDAVSYLSQKLKNSIRTIEGAIKKIGAVSMLTSTPITLEMCKTAVSALVNGDKSEGETIDRIFEIVSEKYGVSIEDIRGKKRNDNIAKARHVCIYMIRNITELSLSDIGKLFSRDHSTVISSIKYIEGQIAAVPGTESEINEMLAAVKL